MRTDRPERGQLLFDQLPQLVLLARERSGHDVSILLAMLECVPGWDLLGYKRFGLQRNTEQHQSGGSCNPGFQHPSRPGRL